MCNKYTFPMAFLFVVACSTAGHSAIVGTTGQIQLIARPESVLNNDLVSDATAVAFNELQFVTLSESVPVDMAGPGTYSNANPPGASSAAIPQGTLVHSYYLHADSVSGAAGAPIVFDGTITFDSRILGIQVRSATLDAGIDPLGAFDVFYPFTVGRSGLEFEPTGGGSGLDTITLSGDRHTVTIHLQTTGQTDQVRIITSVPEPSSLALIGIGGLSLIACLRRRRRERRFSTT
jgi:hypothetical protein